MNRWVTTSVAVAALLAPLAAQERINADINAKIRQEAASHSQIMRVLHMFTDVYGPRVTGSPSLKAAGEWAIKEMTGWGLTNGHLEPWDFGHPGWVNERFSAHIISPVKDQLTCEVVAWTPGTDGPVMAAAYQMALPDKPTPTELTAYLSSQADKVKGKIVLVGAAAVVPVNFDPPAKRRPDDQVRSQYDPNNPNAGQFGRGRGANAPAPPISANEISRQVDEFLVKSGARLRVNDAAREHGQIIAFNNRTYDLSKALPTVVMRNEDYGRIARILADGTPVELEFNIVNRVYPEGQTVYNVIAEIPGSDKRNEIVMLGGHLDSWQSATGATDNAIGCATMMEAARILKAHRRPAAADDPGGAVERRGAGDSRIAGVCQAALRIVRGSEARVRVARARTSISTRAPGAPAARVSSVHRRRPTSSAPRSRRSGILASSGAAATRSRVVAGTDSTSFNNAGLPGIGFGQDPIEYNTHTHHTSLDNYERVVESDVKDSADLDRGCSLSPGDAGRHAAAVHAGRDAGAGQDGFAVGFKRLQVSLNPVNLCDEFRRRYVEAHHAGHVYRIVQSSGQSARRRGQEAPARRQRAAGHHQAGREDDRRVSPDGRRHRRSVRADAGGRSARSPPCSPNAPSRSNARSQATLRSQARLRKAITWPRKSAF